jgi:hypothetical protein
MIALEKRIAQLERLEKSYFSSIEVSPGSIDLNNGNLYGTTPANISDDAAISFTPANNIGLIFIWRRFTTITSWGFVYYRATTSPACVILTGGSTLEATTGVLAGTTGTDAKFTVSAHTDEKIYLENRLGAAVSMHYILFGA